MFCLTASLLLFTCKNVPLKRPGELGTQSWLQGDELYHRHRERLKKATSCAAPLCVEDKQCRGRLVWVSVQTAAPPPGTTQRQSHCVPRVSIMARGLSRFSSVEDCVCTSRTEGIARGEIIHSTLDTERCLGDNIESQCQGSLHFYELLSIDLSHSTFLSFLQNGSFYLRFSHTIICIQWNHWWR